MKFRVLALFFAVGVTASFAQQGFFGPTTNHFKAGDLAPDLHFSKVLSSPGGVVWGPSNLFGQITIIGFFGDTSHNADNVSSWNAMVKKFSAQGVQFVWITDEKESSLLPFLAQHPIQGWLLLDPEKASGREYGLDFPEAVYVGADGKILGFDRTFATDPGLVNAALAGTISTDHGKLDHLDSLPWHMPTPEESRPAFAPSYELHVSLSSEIGNGRSEGPGFMTLKGVDLKSAFEDLDHLSPRRIDVAKSLDDGKRYDLSMVLPTEDDSEHLSQIFRQAVLDHFQISATTETRWVDVYVLTAPKGISSAVKVPDQPGGRLGFFTAGGTGAKQPVSLTEGMPLESLRDVSASGHPEDLCDDLEHFLDRPVVNETNSDVSFSFSVKATGQGKEKNDFLDRLREQTGLVIEPAQRNVDILVIRPR